MLNVACFVQSCLTDADFVIFSNYCLIGTRLRRFLFCQSLSSLRTAMKASVGIWTVPRFRIFFLPAP